MTWLNAGVAGFWYSQGKVPPFRAPEKFLEIPGEPEPGTAAPVFGLIEENLRPGDRFRKGGAFHNILILYRMCSLLNGEGWGVKEFRVLPAGRLPSWSGG
jgi:hypothetical protein